MDDEDGRCLLDVICDPEALNDFLHGSDKLDSDDLLDSTGDAASNYFVGPTGELNTRVGATQASELEDYCSTVAGSAFQLHVQESAANHLNTEPSQPSASVDLDFLEDDILGSPTEGGTNISNSDQPCDILQQSLQEANITEQTLEAEAELDLGSFQLPTLQPVVQAASDATSQIFSSGADLIGLQQSAVLTQQALVQQPMSSDVVNKTISVQPFIQQVGLGNVTIQPISNIQALPNGSTSGTLGIGQIQVVSQPVMAINPPSQQIIAKPVQQTQVTTMPVGSYIAPAAPDQQQVTLNSAGLSPQSAGLVLQKGLPPATAALNGNPMFCSVSTSQGTQSLTVTPSLNSPLVQAPNMIIQRTPTPIQPKPVMHSKYFQITPKLPAPNSALTIQNEVALHPQTQQQPQQQQPQQQQPSPQQKTAQNVTFMAGKPGQNVVLSGFQQSIPANMFKQPQPQQQALGKSMSVHLLNQGGSIVIPAQHVSQTMIQGQNQFLLPGQLTGTSAVQIPQQLSVGGQILATSHPGGQTHIIASQGPGGQLIANHALPAQILTNQNLAGHLNLGQVLAAQNAHGAHILSAPILQPGQMGQPALFQMPVSLASSLTHQSQTSLASSTISQTAQTVIQGVSLPNSVAMLNTTENHGSAVTIQSATTRTQSPSVVQQQSAAATNLLSSTSDQPSLMSVQTAQQPPVPSQAQLCVQQQASQLTPSSRPSPTLASSPEKIILSQAGATPVISQDSMQMFLQQKEQSQQQQFYQKSLNMQQEKIINQPTVLPQSLLLPSYSIATATVTTTSSVPASVIVSSSSSSNVDLAEQPSASRELPSTSNLTMLEPKGPNLIPQFSTGQSQQALVCQMPAGQQKLPGASPSHSLPHQSLGEGSQLQSVHLPQLQSPHQSRPPSQPQPVSRPPSQPLSRPPSQPQSLSRPPSEPVSRSCTPSQPPVQPLFVIQNQISSSPHGSAQHNMRPSSQSQVQAPFQSPVSHSQTETLPQSQLASPPQMQLQVQLAPPFQTQTEAHAQVQPRSQPQALTSVESQHSQPSHFQLQFPTQSQVHTQTAPTLHLTPEQQRNLQLVSSNLQTYSAIPNPSPQQKQMRERLQQVQHSIILHAKQVPTSQPSVSMSQFNSHPTTVFVSSQGQTATMTTVAQAQCHLQGSNTAQSPSVVQNDVSSVHGKVQTLGGGGAAGAGGGQPAQLATLLQQTSVLVKTSSAGINVPVTTEKVFSGGTACGQTKVTSGQTKPGTHLSVQQPGQQTKSGVINSVSGLGKLQVVGKVVSPLLSGSSVQAQQQQQQQVFDSSPGSLKRSVVQQHSKEACFLEQLRKHQGSVLHPDCRSSFSSLEDTLQRLLPYHLYQGTLPSHKDYKKVDEEFEIVSTQLLKRTQAMLNKYRLLLFEEARRLSPSAEMVMIDRMFIQEEKTALVLDKQLAKEKPDEYVSSSYKSPSLVSSSASSNTSEVGHIAECVKVPHMQGAAQINPTKLVIKHSGGSPSISWAKQSSSLDADEDALPSRNKPPIKTYEARSRIGLKLKIKQEAGLSKVIHNTALDPVHQPTTTTVIKTPDHPTMTTCAGHMNGTVDHITSSPAVDRKTAPTATYCRLPLRKTYRENVDAFVTERLTDVGSVSVVRRIETLTNTISVKQDDGSRSVITTVKTEENPPGLTLKETSEENSKISFLKRSETCTLVSQDNFRAKTDDSTSGLMKEIAEVEEEFYHGIVKQEPPDSSAPELAWEVSLPPTKRRKSESLDVDNASFSSDSPQDDSLNEHLQSAIDSILNLQQPHTSGQNARTPASSCNSSSSPFSSPIHRTETYLAPNHNGGLGARTYNR